MAMVWHVALGCVGGNSESVSPLSVFPAASFKPPSMRAFAARRPRSFFASSGNFANETSQSKSMVRGSPANATRHAPPHGPQRPTPHRCIPHPHAPPHPHRAPHTAPHPRRSCWVASPHRLRAFVSQAPAGAAAPRAPSCRFPPASWLPPLGSSWARRCGWRGRPSWPAHVREGRRP